MKTKIEVLGFEIEIEEEDGKLIIEIERDDEIVQELSLDPVEYGDEETEEGEEGNEEGEEGEEGDVKNFDEFSGDEEDNDSEELPEEDEEERALESFEAWASKSKCNCGDDCDCEKCKNIKC